MNAEEDSKPEHAGRRVVMITGSLGNIGTAAAHTFESEGARLVLVDRSQERLRETYGDLEARGHLLLGGIDLTHPEAVEDAMAETLDLVGRLDVLFNTVGAFRGGKPTHEEDLDTWDFLYRLNVRTTLLTCRAALPHMLRQGHGFIINTASPNGFKGTAGFAAYSASKGAVLRLTESLAAEAKEAGVHVNCVVPGTLDTAINRDANPEADFTRWVEPAAVAEVVAFLASKAARGIHGVALPILGLG